MKKMKTSSIGLILLTLMVTTKYYISLTTMTHKDGSLRNGLVIDYAVIQKVIFPTAYAQEPALLAFNPGTMQTVHSNTEHTSQVQFDQVHSAQNDAATGDIATQAEAGPALTEVAVVPVFNDSSNPLGSRITTQFGDPEDSEPLDQGNTLVNEMQRIMPRRQAD